MPSFLYQDFAEPPRQIARTLTTQWAPSMPHLPPRSAALAVAVLASTFASFVPATAAVTPLRGWDQPLGRVAVSKSPALAPYVPIATFVPVATAVPLRGWNQPLGQVAAPKPSPALAPHVPISVRPEKVWTPPTVIAARLAWTPTLPPLPPSALHRELPEAVRVSMGVWPAQTLAIPDVDAANTIAVYASLAGVWTDITADTIAVDGLRIAYGITESGPLACVPGTGECSLTMNNMASPGGRLQGSYSPLHANCRAGWTFDIPLLVACSDSANAIKAVTSITRSSTTATVTTSAAHGYSTGHWVTVAGAAQADYNGVFQITVTGASTFTYAVANAPTTPATGTITVRKAYVKHYGTVQVIDPEAGRYASQKVFVTSYDGIRALAEASVQLPIMTGQTEMELIEAVLDALPAEDQPRARDFDAGVDTFAYAFHDLELRAQALGVIRDVAVDAYALVAMKGDGTLIGRSRQTRALGASAYTFADTMHGFTAPSTRDQVVDYVPVTIHPPTIDDAATTVLYADRSVRAIAAGATDEFWVTYQDPDESRTVIGGLDIVDPLVSGTDYAGNSQADGLGSNLTASLAVAIEPFGATAKLTITNNHASATIYFVDGSGEPFLQIRGKGVYDLGPQTYTAGSGRRELPIDLRYQDDASVAQSYADFVYAQRNSISRQPLSHSFIANASAALMTQALAREPGDVITITETMTGMTLVDAVIQSVSLDVSPGPWVVCTWGLAPTAPFLSWQLGVAGSSELGETTVLGF